MTGKTAIVGDGDSITVFKAAGVAAFPAENAAKARSVIRRIAGEYGVIFLTEDLYREMGDFLKRFDEAPYPAILCVPGKEGGGESYGYELLREEEGRALGVDILFHDE